MRNGLPRTAFVFGSPFLILGFPVSARLAREEKPPAHRNVLILQHWHGWTLAQVAKHLNRTPAAVASLLKRGLPHLREDLAESR